jgi:hypothetical protein
MLLVFDRQTISSVASKSKTQSRSPACEARARFLFLGCRDVDYALGELPNADLSAANTRRGVIENWRILTLLLFTHPGPA